MLIILTRSSIKKKKKIDLHLISTFSFPNENAISFLIPSIVLFERISSSGKPTQNYFASSPPIATHPDPLSRAPPRCPKSEGTISRADPLQTKGLLARERDTEWQQRPSWLWQQSPYFHQRIRGWERYKINRGSVLTRSTLLGAAPRVCWKLGNLRSSDNLPNVICNLR